MTTTLTRERVRRDIEVLAAAGLDIESFLDEATASLSRAVPHMAACIATHDPLTRMLTSDRKYGHLAGINSHDYEFGLMEYGTQEATSFSSIAVAAQPAASVALVHEGDVARSPRMRDFMQAHFDFRDEARLIMRDGNSDWGSVSLFRGSGEQRFTPGEVDFLSSLAPAYARGVRSGILTRMAVGETSTVAGPAVLVVDANDRVAQGTPAAEARLLEIAGPATADPLSCVAALIGTARRYARGRRR